jgi:hypothetical protein
MSFFQKLPVLGNGMKSVPPGLHVDAERKRPGARPAAVVGKQQTPPRLKGLGEQVEKLWLVIDMQENVSTNDGIKLAVEIDVQTVHVEKPHLLSETPFAAAPVGFIHQTQAQIDPDHFGFELLCKQKRTPTYSGADIENSSASLEISLFKETKSKLPAAGTEEILPEDGFVGANVRSAVLLLLNSGGKFKCQASPF